MMFQVPQFIDVEDRIVGPLTIKQFAYVAVGGFICFLLFFPLKIWLWGAIATPIMALTFAFAFVKYNGRSFPALFAAAFSYFWKPRAYLWQRTAPPISPITEITKQALTKKVTERRTVSFFKKKLATQRPAKAEIPAPEKTKPAAPPPVSAAETPAAPVSPKREEPAPVRLFEATPTAEIPTAPPERFRLSDLGFKLSSFSGPIAGREKAVPLEIAPSKEARVGILKRLMREREVARRIDYR